MSNLVLAAFGKQPLTHSIDGMVEVRVGDMFLFAYQQPTEKNLANVALAHDVLIRGITGQLPVVPVSFGHFIGSQREIAAWANTCAETLQQSYASLHNVAQMSLFLNAGSQASEPSSTNFLRQKAGEISVARHAKDKAYVLAERLVALGVLTAFSVDHSRALNGQIRIDGLVSKDDFEINNDMLTKLVSAQDNDIRISGPFLPYRFFSRLVSEGKTQ
jgi:hypothetical protein